MWRKDNKTVTNNSNENIYFDYSPWAGNPVLRYLLTVLEPQVPSPKSNFQNTVFIFMFFSSYYLNPLKIQQTSSHVSIIIFQYFSDIHFQIECHPVELSMRATVPPYPWTSQRAHSSRCSMRPRLQNIREGVIRFHSLTYNLQNSPLRAGYRLQWESEGWIWRLKDEKKWKKMNWTLSSGQCPPFWQRQLLLYKWFKEIKDRMS